MASRASFYNTGYFQRGGVPLATLPAQVMYPTNSFGFGPRYVTANPAFVSSAYGDPYGFSTSWIPGARWTRSDLQSRKANVSTYDHYDAVTNLIAAGRSYSDIEAFPGYSSFTTLASNDSAALLKTGYWLAVGFLALNDTSLRDAAKERLAAGLKSGVDVDAANRNGSIKSTYDSAYALLEKALKRTGNTNEVAKDALEQLRKGTDRKAVASRVDEAQKLSTARQAVEDAPPPKKPDVPCADSWMAYIPGYCTAKEAQEMALLGAKIAGGVVVAGALIWGVRFAMRRSAAKSNPLSDAYNPAKKKPMPALADKQEAYLARTVLRKRNT
jgi:hypothetical protein